MWHHEDVFEHLQVCLLTLSNSYRICQTGEGNAGGNATILLVEFHRRHEILQKMTLSLVKSKNNAPFRKILLGSQTGDWYHNYGSTVKSPQWLLNIHLVDIIVMPCYWQNTYKLDRYNVIMWHVHRSKNFWNLYDICLLVTCVWLHVCKHTHSFS